MIEARTVVRVSDAYPPTLLPQGATREHAGNSAGFYIVSALVYCRYMIL